MKKVCTILGIGCNYMNRLFKWWNDLSIPQRLRLAWFISISIGIFTVNITLDDKFIIFGIWSLVVLPRL